MRHCFGGSFTGEPHFGNCVFGIDIRRWNLCWRAKPGKTLTGVDFVVVVILRTFHLESCRPTHITPYVSKEKLACILTTKTYRIVATNPVRVLR